MPAPTPEELKTLPDWAQAYIQRLERWLGFGEEREDPDARRKRLNRERQQRFRNRRKT
jgi:hypothetical protein